MFFGLKLCLKISNLLAFDIIEFDKYGEWQYCRMRLWEGGTNNMQKQEHGYHRNEIRQTGSPSRLGVALLCLLILAAILALLFVSPPEAARVVRAA